MLRSYREPYDWWGAHWGPAATQLSLFQLVEAGSLDLRLASLLWLVLERHGSLIVAAEPSLAGKSTTLTALLALLPPDVEPVYTRGAAETFDFVDATDPRHTIILVNEISSQLPSYLWGPAVRDLFAMLQQGYALAATMHAGLMSELVAQLEAEPLSVPREAMAGVTAVCFVSADRTTTGYRRQVSSLWLLDGEEPSGLGWAPAAWRDARGGLVHSDDPELLGRLARRLGFDSGALRSAWWQHFDYLRAQYASGRRGGVAMREAVLAFYSEAAVGRL